MNRYELHEALKEAREEGAAEALSKVVAEQRMYHPTASSNQLAMPFGTGSNGKYKCVLEFKELYDRAAYELRATLYVNRKFYNATQIISYDMWGRLVADDSYKRFLENWQDGACKAMWAEFRKDVEITPLKIDPRYTDSRRFRGFT